MHGTCLSSVHCSIPVSVSSLHILLTSCPSNEVTVPRSTAPFSHPHPPAPAREESLSCVFPADVNASLSRLCGLTNQHPPPPPFFLFPLSSSFSLFSPQQLQLVSARHDQHSSSGSSVCPRSSSLLHFTHTNTHTPNVFPSYLSLIVSFPLSPTLSHPLPPIPPSLPVLPRQCYLWPQRLVCWGKKEREKK